MAGAAKILFLGKDIEFFCPVFRVQRFETDGAGFGPALFDSGLYRIGCVEIFPVLKTLQELCTGKLMGHRNTHVQRCVPINFLLKIGRLIAGRTDFKIHDGCAAVAPMNIK